MRTLNTGTVHSPREEGIAEQLATKKEEGDRKEVLWLLTPAVSQSPELQKTSILLF